MAERTIALHPSNRYRFRQDWEFREPWAFLPHPDRSRIIGQQLTYLAFHEWLMDNLRHSDKKQPSVPDWSELVFNVAEGFFKTDVLLYASICEAALYSVLRKCFEITGTSAIEELKACFEVRQAKFHKLYKDEIETASAIGRRKGFLALHWEQVVPLADSEVRLAQLIKAGERLNIYDTKLRKKLDDLRDARNAIHLANQLRRRKSTAGLFSSSDRQQAKDVTEELRVALESYVELQKWPSS
ncbi:MAG: hypothetical protein HY043_22910 [Verrucomicrobia bacterium]|nr:hypothetical protein [Verrucomicrobiota bacterium]